MGEVRRPARGQARDHARDGLGRPVAVADQRPVLVSDPDAVGVAVRGLHGVAEDQRLGARAAEQRRALAAAHGQHEVRVGRGVHRLVEGHRDLDDLARAVGLRRRPRGGGHRHAARDDEGAAVHPVARLRGQGAMAQTGVDGCVTLPVDGAAVQRQRIGGDGDAVLVVVVRRHRVGEYQLRGGAFARRVGGMAGVRTDGQRQPRRAARGVHRDRLVEDRRDPDDVAGHVAAVGVRGRGDRRTSHYGAVRAVDADFLRPGKRSPTVGAPHIPEEAGVANAPI